MRGKAQREPALRAVSSALTTLLAFCIDRSPILANIPFSAIDLL